MPRRNQNARAQSKYLPPPRPRNQRPIQLPRPLEGIKWARLLSERPECIPKHGLRGAQAKGIKYERLVAADWRRQFGPETRADQWVEFEDIHDHGYLCMDVFVSGPKAVLLGECKLTWTPQLAWWQMEKRYAPVLRHIFGLPVSTLQVCRFLAHGHPIETEMRRSPRYLFDNPEPGRFTWHWSGR